MITTVRYTTTSNKHVIIELKRPKRVVSTGELLDQGSKYRSGLRKLLVAKGRGSEPIEVVFVVGKELSDWQDPTSREESAGTLRPKNMRVVMYQELLESAGSAYREYLAKKSDTGRIAKLIHSIDTADMTS